MIILALVRAAVLWSAADITPDTKQAIQPMQIYFKSRNPSDPRVFKRICMYMQMSNYNVQYTIGKLQRQDFQQAKFCQLNFDKLKVISEKPKVNQVVPYTDLADG